ncbi:MAG: hypothetical protein HQL54_14520 [Magnetococcales bacterium]|nr:hypothetical protein [Magnetococcales bacterium]
MRYAVQVFDGEHKSWYMIDKDRVSSLFNMVHKAEADKGAQILNVMPEKNYISHQQSQYANQPQLRAV